ncbi:MAG: helix-turn-helix domain-containing protein [Chloroflexia bacterium]|nr:helix-turn-helix domain-containing protein [Chloroflexia bacterium]
MDLLTVKETAEILRVSPITVRRYIASGRLAAERVGRGIRVRREAIERFVTRIVPRSAQTDERLMEVSLASNPDVSEWMPDELPTFRNSLDDIIGIGRSSSRFDFDDDVDELPTMRETLGISIGIGRSSEPTNIAEHKDEYLADAFEAKG